LTQVKAASTLAKFPPDAFHSGWIESQGAIMFKRVFIAAVLATTAGLFSVPSASAAGALALGTEPGRVWYGVNSNSNTIGQAQRQATRVCRQHGPCRIATTFWNKCIAFAWQGSGRSGYGWATRDTPRQAERAALRACERHGLPCVVQDMHCDTTGR
jgi:hypothetical protein